VNDKSLYTLIAIASVLLVLIATEYFITMEKASKTMTMKDNLFSQHKLKPTMFMSLKKGQYLSLIEVKNRTLKVEFIGVKLGNKSRIVKELKSKKISFKATVKDELLRLEFKI